MGTRAFRKAIIIVGLLPLSLAFLGVYTIVEFKPITSIVVGIALLLCSLLFVLFMAQIVREHRNQVRNDWHGQSKI